MKKLLISLIAVLMVFLGTSCGGGSSSDETNNDSDQNKNDSDSAEAQDSDGNTTNDSDTEETSDEDQNEPLPVLSEDEKLESVKNLAEEYVNFSHGTGVVVGYGRDELTSFTYGIRDIGKQEKINVDDLFEIGSITKSFTAVTILKLAEEGEISLDDKISKWFPDFDKGDQITVKMLLNHTSGIREMTEILEPDKVVENVKGRFNFEPGKGWADTNSDYIMAGLIIEQVTGKKAHEVIREKIIDPLELKNTFMKGYEEYPKNREVKGHNFNKYGELQPYTFDRKTWTAGSMVSNAGDLFKYAYALFNGEILSEKSYKQMIEPAAEDITYGLGVSISQGTHGTFYTLAGNASAAKNIAMSHSLLSFYPNNGSIHVILNNFTDNKDIFVLNDEIEWVLVDNFPIKKRTDFPNWKELIDGKANTQIFALYSLATPVFDYGIGYFAYPSDNLPNYYCKQYLYTNQKKKAGAESEDDVELEVVIAQDCTEPKEYIVLTDSYQQERTEIRISFEEFKKAVESKKPTSKFTVAKGDYFLDNLEVNKICAKFEDNKKDSDKTMTIIKDDTVPGAQIYRIWGNAKMTESTYGCYCLEKDEETEENKIVQCPAD